MSCSLFPRRRILASQLLMHIQPGIFVLEVNWELLALLHGALKPIIGHLQSDGVVIVVISEHFGENPALTAMRNGKCRLCQYVSWNDRSMKL